MDSEEGEESLASAWGQLAMQHGLLRSSATEPPNGTGVSLAYLELLAASLQQLDEEFDVPISTGDVMHDILLPALAQQSGRNRLLEVVPTQHTGPPQWYVCHAWSAGFLELVTTLQHDLAPEPGPTEPPLPPDFKDNIMLHIDLFAINHYPVQTPHVLDDAALRALAADAEAKMKDTMDACSDGVLLVVDQGLRCLQRVWVMFEAFQAAYTYGTMGVRLALPELLSLERVLFFKQEACNVDFSKLSSRKAQDKKFLLSLVKHRCGLQRTNNMISEALDHALHHKLRWRARLWETATLAAVLLSDGKLTQLQLLLNPIAELRDDEESLKEMRALFKSFDKDGSGEIDEWEFVDLLCVAGWTKEDATAAFCEVNTDRQGGVSQDEFEQWWRKRAVEEYLERQASGGDLTIQAMLTNLERLSDYLGRMQLQEHSDFFRMQAAKLGPKYSDEDRSAHAPPPNVKGDLVTSLDHIGERVFNKDLLGACFLMYDLILTNHELLNQDPMTLQTPADPQTTQDQAQLLVVYMEMFIKMVKYQMHQRASQYDFLKECVAELKAGPAKGLDWRKKQGDDTNALANRLALRENLRVKPGSNHRITPRQVQELQTAVSQFVANLRNIPNTKRAGAALPSPTQMILHHEQAEKTMRKGSTHLALGDVNMPSLADLRSKLRDGVNRERLQELGLPAPPEKDKDRQRRLQPSDMAGPWARAASTPDLAALEEGRTSGLPSLTTGGAKRRPNALALSPRGHNGTPHRSATGNVSASGASPSGSTVNPKGQGSRLWVSCMDDLVDRSLRRSADDAPGTRCLKPTLSGFLQSTDCSSALKALSSELNSVRSGSPRHQRRGGEAPATPSAEGRYSLPQISSPSGGAASGAAGQVARSQSRLMSLKQLKKRDSFRSATAHGTG